jgi:hypothetical protein
MAGAIPAARGVNADVVTFDSFVGRLGAQVAHVTAVGAGHLTFAPLSGVRPVRDLPADAQRLSAAFTVLLIVVAGYTLARSLAAAT